MRKKLDFKYLIYKISVMRILFLSAFLCFFSCNYQLLDPQTQEEDILGPAEDYALDPRDEENRKRLMEEILDAIEREGLPRTRENYAIDLHFYIVNASNEARVAMGGGRHFPRDRSGQAGLRNRSLNLTGALPTNPFTGREVFNLDYDETFLKELTTKWGFFSINAIYSRTGVWFRNITVYEIEDPVTGIAKNPEVSSPPIFSCVGNNGGYMAGVSDADLTEFEHVDSFIDNANRDDFIFKLARPVMQNGVTYNYVRSSCNEYRIIWMRSEETDKVETSRAILEAPSTRMLGRHGRNILAHELGHNFNLLHTIEYEASRPSLCNFSDGITYSMYTPILDSSYGFSPCEIAIIQSTINYWLEKGGRFIRKEAPSADKLEIGRAFYDNKFGNVGCFVNNEVIGGVMSTCSVNFRTDCHDNKINTFAEGNHNFTGIDRTIELGVRAYDSYRKTHQVSLPPDTLPPRPASCSD